MSTVCLHNKNTIERILKGNINLHIYSLGDLDDFFWPYTTWYASTTSPNIKEFDEIVLLYIGQSLPTLLAFSDKPERLNDLVDSLLHLLPQRFHAHLSPGVESILGQSYALHSYGKHLKMALKSHNSIDTYDYSNIELMKCRDLEEIIDFYQRSYPENWFDPRMLETNQYFGIRENGSLICVAGIHVYSPKYKVAALGNITTIPEHRGRGYATRVTAKTCQSLLKDVQHIGLNVKADNNAAISCYKKLGFETIASYNEYTFERK